MGVDPIKAARLSPESAAREAGAAVNRRAGAGQVGAAEVLSRVPDVHVSHGHTEEVLIIVLM